MPVKTGLLGGAFNPPHLAHLSLAVHAKKAFHLDEVIFVPTRIPPHKAISGDWDERTRSLMIRIATFSDEPSAIGQRLRSLTGLKKDPAQFLIKYEKEYAKEHDPAFSVSDIEIDRPEISYTIDTVRSVLEKGPERVLYVIIGMDQAAVFNTWKDWEELPRLAHICAANRPGNDEDAIMKNYPFIEPFNIPPIPVSSTEIREKIAKHQSIGPDVPKIIEDFLSLITG